MTTIVMVLKMISAFFSPEFEAIIGQIQEERRRDLTRRIETAKAAAQDKQSPSTRDLQKVTGELTE